MEEADKTPVVSEAPEPQSPSFPLRTWISSQGNKATLALVRVEDDKVVVKNDEGKEWVLGFNRFSEADQDYARRAYAKWLSENDK